MNGVAVTPDPGIRLALDAGRVTVQRDGADIEAAFCTRPVAAALQLIPTLLPVCGMAQQLAGLRAATAAGYRSRPSQETDLAGQIASEQIIACGWRVGIDWPRLIGAAADIDAVKRLRNAHSAQTQHQAAAALLPGLSRLRHINDIWDWARDQHCNAATLLHRARHLGDPPGEHRLLSGSELVDAAGQRLMNPTGSFSDPIEVGPLAMRRHPLIHPDLAPDIGHRLAASLLDFQALLDTPRQQPQQDQWTLADGSGLGRAQTARGPLFHRVVLNKQHTRALSWQLLAPTDWHFGSGGVIEAARTSNTALPYLALSLDPCAPWQIAAAEGLAHA